MIIELQTSRHSKSKTDTIFLVKNVSKTSTTRLRCFFVWNERQLCSYFQELP